LTLVLYFHADNQRLRLIRARRHAIKCWAELLMVVLEYCDLDSGVITTLALKPCRSYCLN
jgi:hypothetical protein